MKKWIEGAMGSTSLIIAAIIMLAAGGWMSLKEIPLEKLPDVDVPYLTVTVPYPGASPMQGMRSVGQPMEQALVQIEGLAHIYTNALPNAVQVMMEFDVDTSMEDAENAVEAAIRKTELPEEAKEPVIGRKGPGSRPEYSFAVYGEGEEAYAALRQHLEGVVIPKLTDIEGVEEVSDSGASKQEVRITADPLKMGAYGLTLEHLRQALGQADVSLPAGETEDDRQRFSVQAGHRFDSLGELERLPVSLQSGRNGAGLPRSSVPLSEVARVELAESAASEGVARYNGQPASVIEVRLAGGADTVKAIQSIREILNKQQWPKGVTWAQLADEGEEIKASVNSMLRELVFGALLAAAVTLLFLRNVRSTLIALLSIPLSMLATIVFLNAMGYTLNTMTLAGMAVAVGRVVDDSIVVIENVFRRLESQAESGGVDSGSAYPLAEAAAEVAKAITASTLTTIVVFIPIAFVPGLVGKFFEPFAWSVVIALAFSLLVAITAVPMLSKLFLANRQHKHREHGHGFGIRAYHRLLAWSLRHKAAVLSLSAVMVLGSLGLGSQLPRTFFPPEETAMYTLHAPLPEGSRMEQAETLADGLEDILRSRKEVRNYSSIVRPEGVRTEIVLQDGAHAAEFEKNTREALEGAKEAIGSEVQVSLTGKSSVGSGSLNVLLTGDDRSELEKAGEQISSALDSIDGLADVKASGTGTYPQIDVEVDPAKAAAYGLQPAAVSALVRERLSGVGAGTVTVGDHEREVSLGWSGELDPEALPSLPLLAPPGQPPVMLKDVARVERKEAPAAVQHRDRQVYASVTGKITALDTAKVQREVRKAIDALELPDEVSYSFGGDQELMREGFRNMGQAILLGVGLVFLVMLAAFRRLSVAVTVLGSLPFVFVGAVGGLLLSGDAIGMPALVGILMLVGIVVTNAIVLMDRVVGNRSEGMDLEEALLEAAGTRLRPILMTALATVGALLPLAFSSGGGLISKTLAIVVISGLTTSTLLTLLIVPVIYMTLEHRKKQPVRGAWE